MNLLHLKYAVEIAKTKSISRAAENLYMGQPNLSRAIKELEDSLNITIFNRTSKGITITPDGEEFLQYATRVINQVEQIEEKYQSGKDIKTQRLSVCAPRASYISYAFAEFSKTINTEIPAELFYKETNSYRTINSIVRGDYDLGIVRYQTTFDKYFKTQFREKHLVSEVISDFQYMLMMSRTHPLANKKSVRTSELADYIEISHADPYVPSLPLIDVKKEELSKYVDKHIFVFERSSQFMLLETVPNTFMWLSPLPQDLMEKHNLIVKKCDDNQKKYKDVLIYRNGYKLTDLDNRFIEKVIEAKERYL